MKSNIHNPPVFELKKACLGDRIKGLEFSINKGECWHLIGPNGAGKSSIVLLLAGLEPPSSGRITLLDMPMHEQSLSQQAQTRCFLHQHQQCEFDIPLSQLLSFYTQMSALPKHLDKCLDINKFLHKPLSELSGGQQQRFHIARSLCQIWPAISSGRGVIVFDEPITHLDIKFQTAIMAFLQQLCESGNTVIVSCHDINLSIKYASHVGLVHNQRLVNAGAADTQLSLKNLQIIFDHHFLEINDAAQPNKYIVSSSNQSI
jgi:vitamin B12 transport system ATP-binding protein